MEHSREEFLEQFSGDYGYPDAPRGVHQMRAADFKRLQGVGAIEFILCHAEVEIAFGEEKKVAEHRRPTSFSPSRHPPVVSSFLLSDPEQPHVANQRLTLTPPSSDATVFLIRQPRALSTMALELASPSLHVRQAPTVRASQWASLPIPHRRSPVGSPAPPCKPPSAELPVDCRIHPPAPRRLPGACLELSSPTMALDRLPPPAQSSQPTASPNLLLARAKGLSSQLLPLLSQVTSSQLPVPQAASFFPADNPKA
ncbi:hypothetical protein ZWY2020_052047 [Hordeum vulgare]|nr:hypothetical protein ZWY2020_052047 [Hordeum vulgare]